MTPWIIASATSYVPAKSMANYRKCCTGPVTSLRIYLRKHRDEVCTTLATMLADRL
ncbi:hypothetical protein AB0C38_30310 [Amycolatopsis sp. NPDC048633]|uniref:hypothetical protein n=1 Tax=Amycolatopsis sp. NPDC048633 TaxID=3157095 RepID=UPI003407E59F